MTILKTSIISLIILIGLTTEKGIQVGDKAIDFNLKNIDGSMVSLNTKPDVKGYILVFTCNTCPYSVMYEDRIVALDKMYASKGYPVLAIQPNNAEKSPGDSFELMQERAKDKGFTFPYLIDETQETTAAYGATNTPHVYVLNKQSDDSFEVAYIGAIDNNSRNAAAADKHYVQEAINSLLANEEVSNTKTKAIGCTIKWAN